MALNIKSFNDLFKGSLYRDLHKLCDATIVAEDGTEFNAHKLFLSMKSEYFRTYFRGNIEKKNRLVVAVPKDILEDILIFIYCGEVRLHTHNIASTIIAADYFQIDDLLPQCIPFALREISVENCTSLLVASYIVERLGIAEHCYRFVQVHFESLVHNINSGIEELPYNTLKSLLKDDSLCVANEETVWKAIEIWVNGNDEERLKYVPELLTYIRWNSDNYRLASYICENSIVRENVFCRNIDLEKYASTSKYKMPQSDINNTFPDRCHSKMYIFVCRNTSPYLNNTSEIYLTYDEQIDIWRKVGETDEDFHALFAKNSFIFTFNKVSKEMKAFDLLKKVWVKKENMRSARQAYCAVQCENSLFVVGGFNFMMINTDVECYDILEDTWKYCMSIPPINISGAAVISKTLYVIGFPEDSDILEMRALAYNTLTDDWSDIEKPKQFRINFGIINFRDQLYILGGRTEENSITTSVEKYSAVNNEWEEFPPLPFPYELPQAIILQDKLMVFDDCPISLVDKSRFSPCVWNDEAQAWDVEMISSPFNQIHMYALCCIEDRDILLDLSKENKDSETVWRKSPFAIN